MSTATAPWSALGKADSLSAMFDWTSVFGLGSNLIHYIVINGFFSGQLGAPTVVYTGIVMMLVMVYVASGYIMIKAVDAGVSM